MVAVEFTGKNLFRAVALYNQRPESARIEYMRVCLVMKLPRARCVNQLRFPIVCCGLNTMQRQHVTCRANAQVSGGLFRHEEVSKQETAKALISGISAAFHQLCEEGNADRSSSGKRVLPHVNFAFDEDMFGLAYSRMVRAMHKRTGSKDAQSASAGGGGGGGGGSGGGEKDQEISVAANAGPDDSVPPMPAERKAKDGTDSKAAVGQPAA